MSYLDFRRFFIANLMDALADTPCVLLHGPRQRGKTTLTHQLVSHTNARYRYYTFDDSVLGTAKRAPTAGLALYFITENTACPLDLDCGPCLYHYCGKRRCFNALLQ